MIENDYSITVKEMGVEGIQKLIDNLESNHVDFQLTTKLYRLLALLKAEVVS